MAARIAAWWRKHWVKWLLGLLLFAALLRPLALSIFGLVFGLDVGSMLVHLYGGSHGSTIASSALSDYRPVAVEWLGDIESLSLEEASGIALSNVREDVLWAHNDSGNAHDLYAMGLDGRDLGTVRVEGLGIGDWEDIAAFMYGGKPYLLVGNTGDNYRWRPVLELYAIEEPALVDGRAPEGATARVAWTIRYRYPEGRRRDCEGIAVDVEHAQVLLTSKRVIPAEVYRVPLRPADSAVVEAEQVGLLDRIPQPDARDKTIDPDYWQWRSQPTALALQPMRAVVVTNKDAYVYERVDQEDWSQVFARTPQRLRLPPVHGREAADLSRDGRYLYVTAERWPGLDAAVFRVTLTP